MDRDMIRDFTGDGAQHWCCSSQDCTWTLPDIASALTVFERHVCDTAGRFEDEEIERYDKVPHAS